MAKDKRVSPSSSVDIGVLTDGMVVMQFAEAIKQMTLSPEQAKKLGVGLIEMGTKAESLQRVQPPEKTSFVATGRKH